MPIKRIDNRTFKWYNYQIYRSISRNENVAGWKCDCKGYMFNLVKRNKKTCRHIRVAKLI